MRDIACELLSSGVENTQLTTATGEIWDLDAHVADHPNCCIVLAWDEGEQDSLYELVASELGRTCRTCVCACSLTLWPQCGSLRAP